MKLRNRILSIIMVLAMLVSSVVVFAEDAAENIGTAMPAPTEKLYGKLLLLESLGLFEDMTNLALDETVTRAQFATWLEKVANLTEKKAYMPVDFSDVPKNHEQYDSIQNVVSAGYMSGMGGTVFMPNATIKLSDVAVSLIRLMEREAYALIKGGYPVGYEQTARQLKLYDGVKTNENTTINVLVMLYNVLNADYLAPSGLTSEGIMYLPGETVLSYFHDIYEIEGTMTANGYTKVYSDEIIADADIVEIDKVIYECSNNKLHSLLGKYVRGFYRYDKEMDTRELVSAYADEDDNTIMELPSKGLRLVGNTLYYPIDDGAREKKVELENGFDFIYNNRAVTTRLNSDILIADGELTLIDKNNDRRFDTVIAWDRITEKVTGIDANRLAIYTETQSVVSPEYDASAFVIKNVDDEGNASEISVDEVSIGAVATIYRSKDGVYTEVYLTENSIFGVPTSIDEQNHVYIDNVKYEIARPSAESDIIIGMSVDILLDYMGRIAYVERATNYDYVYGYVFSIKEDHEKEAWVIKMLTPSGEKKYAVNSKVMIDGVSGCAPSLLDLMVTPNSMIRFRLGKDETIRSVDTINSNTYDERHDKLTVTHPRQTLMYYPYTKTFGQDGEFRMAADTFFVLEPTNAEERKNTKMYKTGYTFYSDPSGYDFTIYDLDPDKLTVGACIYHHTESLKVPAVNDKSPVGVFVKAYREWDDGEDVLKMVIHDKDSYNEYTVGESVSSIRFEDVKFGDVIRYALDGEGNVGNFAVELSVGENSPRKSDMKFQTNGTDRYAFGQIQRRENGYLVIQPLGVNYKTTVDTSSVGEYTVVDMAERKISTETNSNFTSGVSSDLNSPSWIYARLYKNYDTPEIVIYKY